jgi:hypothetical protein
LAGTLRASLIVCLKSEGSRDPRTPGGLLPTTKPERGSIQQSGGTLNAKPTGHVTRRRRPSRRRRRAPAAPRSQPTTRYLTRASPSGGRPALTRRDPATSVGV